jgi:hypothetical protein
MPGDARTTTGRIDPAGRRVRHLKVQPGGTRLLMGMLAISATGNVEGNDLWLTNLDGSNTVRYTRTNVSSYGVWSPDGQRIAFDVDPGSVCTGGTCTGNCAIWHAPATAKELNPLPAAPGGAAQFEVHNAQGRSRKLGCNLLAWTP